jgi:hypothetical protein
MRLRPGDKPSVQEVWELFIDSDQSPARNVSEGWVWTRRRGPPRLWCTVRNGAAASPFGKNIHAALSSAKSPCGVQAVVCVKDFGRGILDDHMPLDSLVEGVPAFGPGIACFGILFGSSH